MNPAPQTTVRRMDRRMVRRGYFPHRTPSLVNWEEMARSTLSPVFSTKLAMINECGVVLCKVMR